MTEYDMGRGTGPQQTDGFFHYSFQRVAGKHVGEYTQIHVKAVDHRASERLAEEARRTQEITNELKSRDDRAKPPRTLARYVRFREDTGGHGTPVLVLGAHGIRESGRFLETAVQEDEVTLPLSAKQVRELGINLYEALTVLHGIGYAHGEVGAQNLLWDEHNAVLARCHAAERDHSGTERGKDVAEAARLLHYVATGSPIEAGTPLSPQAQRDLEACIRGLGSVVARALAPPRERIDAADAYRWLRDLAVGHEDEPGGRAPRAEIADTAAERREREAFREIRNRHRAQRRARYPEQVAPPPPRVQPPLPGGDFLPRRSLWRVFWNEGIGAAAREVLTRFMGMRPGPRALTVFGVAGAVAVLVLLLGGTL
ncbi:hypothetical protein [Actinorugispora endophytica]|uniref:Protein kinase domain-containing protein n=1 Tax=Actinorugispora endophytica TaxID=1605990 RepID=A0A4R6UZM3_9ACTN|nr:hypothetical protein [Actinorugispora endophytica]TDQ51589.1 hypothetical protein EV190_11078 [Actinorugispora endophytica]